MEIEVLEHPEITVILADGQRKALAVGRQAIAIARGQWSTRNELGSQVFNILLPSRNHLERKKISC